MNEIDIIIENRKAISYHLLIIELFLINLHPIDLLLDLIY